MPVLTPNPDVPARAPHDPPQPAREACVASWDAAKRRADVMGYATSTAASVAGQYLEITDGDALEAIAVLPADVGPFWTAVRAALTSIVEEG